MGADARSTAETAGGAGGMTVDPGPPRTLGPQLHPCTHGRRHNAANRSLGFARGEGSDLGQALAAGAANDELPGPARNLR